MNDTLDLFRRYTSLAGTAGGPTDYYSEPHEVVNFNTIVVEMLATVLLGLPGPVTIAGQLEQSSDLNNWSKLGAVMAPAAGVVGTVTVSGFARYVRLRITVSAADSVVTLWASAVARQT